MIDTSLYINLNKKRFKILAAFSVGFHIIGALFVLYSLVFNIDTWTEYMDYSRLIIGLEKHNHKPYVVLNIWMVAIQIRYVITDSVIFYDSLRSHKLLLYTIKMHGVESAICSVTFLLHQSNDCFIFGIICICWTFLWAFSYFLIKKKHKEC